MKVCLAGTYCREDMIQKCGLCDYVLESFWYIKEWQLSKIKNCKLFLLDSGAFTFMVNSHKKEINWDQYVEEYGKFVKENNIKHFFELDIDSIVGIKEVERLRDKLEKIAGRKCIPVWHKSRGLDYWKRIVKEYDYVAIGGIVTKEIKSTEYAIFTYLLDMAKKNNCKVHGLGFTGIEYLKKYHFYSVDSTAWSSGWRFGTLYKFTGKSFKKIKFKNMRIKKEEGKNVDIFNYLEWIKFQKYADKHL
jgi:hypothetical protein